MEHFVFGYLQLGLKDDGKLIFLEPNIISKNLANQFLTFNDNENDAILNKILQKKKFSLSEKEVANGIHPHHDFVNRKISKISNFKIGEGIFGLSDDEKNNLKLSENELKLIKPYFTSEQFSRYYASCKNNLWLIYTSSKFKNPSEIIPYPNIKNHLDKVYCLK